MASALGKMKKPLNRKGPLLTVVMDGVGCGPHNEGNAVYTAYTPFLDKLKKEFPYRKIFAHGPYVGLPTMGDMGNSEVGHNAIGAGKVYAQGAKLVNKSLDSGRMFQGEVWQKIITNCKKNDSPLHFIGLLSDGNVHSHIDQLKKMITRAGEENIKKLYVHAVLDGRDVEETSAPVYIKDLEAFFKPFNQAGKDYRIATVGGRMVVTMDRYEADWEMVEKGWQLMVEGKGRQFNSALKGYKTMQEESGQNDQFLPPFIVKPDDKDIAAIDDGASVIFFNFRGDRALEISRAFDDKNLNTIKRQKYPDVFYAGMMEYDGDLHIPAHYLVTPPAIENALGAYMTATGIRQFAISETQKYGHVTYFWNGNRSNKFSEELEDYLEIPSDRVPFEQRPWMKCAEITDKVMAYLQSGKYAYGRINYPNGDMVGHTGILQAARIAMEALDLQLRRLLKVVKDTGGIALLTADHGNADEMYMLDKQGGIKRNKDTGLPLPKTSHTLNQVPVIIYDPAYQGEYEFITDREAGLSNLGATMLNLMGYEAPADYDKSLLQFK